MKGILRVLAWVMSLSNCIIHLMRSKQAITSLQHLIRLNKSKLKTLLCA